MKKIGGITASDKKVKVTRMTLQHIVKGKIIEKWDEMIVPGIVQKLVQLPNCKHLNLVTKNKIQFLSYFFMI